MAQLARNLTDGFEPVLEPGTRLLRDRDPLYTAKFVEMLETAGVRDTPLPARSPNLNAYAERFVGSVRRECLEHLIIVSGAHLRRVLEDYVEHYHAERPHQSVGNKVIRLPLPSQPRAGPIQRTERLGGLLKSYRRRAA